MYTHTPYYNMNQYRPHYRSTYKNRFEMVFMSGLLSSVPLPVIIGGVLLVVVIAVIASKPKPLPIGTNIELVNYPTIISALCANPSAKGKDRTKMKWVGKVCNNKNGIEWTSMQSTDKLRPGLATSMCSWNRSNHNNSWQQQWIGSCGVAPKNIPDLPMNVSDVKKSNKANK